jgi:cbb3-type cytochrome oxidase subunit 3
MLMFFYMLMFFIGVMYFSYKSDKADEDSVIF